MCSLNMMKVCLASVLGFLGIFDFKETDKSLAHFWRETVLNLKRSNSKKKNNNNNLTQS